MQGRSQDFKSYQKLHNNFISLFFMFPEDTLNVIKPELMMRGRDGRPVQRTRRRFSVRETNKQIRS